jgi:hypothetical protein
VNFIIPQHEFDGWGGRILAEAGKCLLGKRMPTKKLKWGNDTFSKFMTMNKIKCRAKILVHKKTGEFGGFPNCDLGQMVTSAIPPQLFPVTSSIRAMEEYNSKYIKKAVDLKDYRMIEVSITEIKPKSKKRK